MQQQGLTKASRIFVAGHRGMVGSAIVRRLQDHGYLKPLTASRAEMDLTRQDEVERYFADQQIDYVVVAAARVGGIHANDTYPAEFIYQNLMIQSNLIHSAHRAGVPQLLFLGSSCIYPVLAEQPMQEGTLLTGPLEPTNEPYAVAKIAGIKMCESYNRQYGTDYRSAMPTNLYGQGDNFHPENSHVIPALIRRIDEAKDTVQPTVTIWGSGAPRREFLYVDDLADACVHLMEMPTEDYQSLTDPRVSHVNLGTGVDVTIRELAVTICDVVGYQGKLEFDASKPDGAPRKLLDVSRLDSLGWRYKVALRDGLRKTYQWYLENGKGAGRR